ncbi:hypothetical protein BGP77_05430 [Saccharospirillum sp. MSK14-1]|uniref:DUF4389 domain-containing protein n=1 Tax=Saccharospirillum sp. MSK14-1 TaxID=1897632 RepID=UPI000D3CB369|nr:DUF4389 domain-containing protein [Saccharospirillum sp. MSK14-1]PTY36731.1 hypothetical protein BGP77_05430 [Saccharospirillum sp. MSK14-1]
MEANRRERSEHQLLRLVFMVIFGVVLRLSVILTFLLAAVQWIWRWFQSEENERLRGFCLALGRYQHQVLDYLLFNTEAKPFPFADWPADESGWED